MTNGTVYILYLGSRCHVLGVNVSYIDFESSFHLSSRFRNHRHLIAKLFARWSSLPIRAFSRLNEDLIEQHFSGWSIIKGSLEVINHKENFNTCQLRCLLHPPCLELSDCFFFSFLQITRCGIMVDDNLSTVVTYKVALLLVREFCGVHYSSMFVYTLRGISETRIEVLIDIYTSVLSSSRHSNEIGTT